MSAAHSWWCVAYHRHVQREVIGHVRRYKEGKPRRSKGHSMSDTFTMYSTPWCGYCHRLKGQLVREGIDFTVVDIEQHPEAAAIVEKANRGNQTVPTLVFPDGSALTNPSVAQVKARLLELAS